MSRSASDCKSTSDSTAKRTDCSARRYRSVTAHLDDQWRRPATPELQIATQYTRTYIPSALCWVGGLGDRASRRRRNLVPRPVRGGPEKRPVSYTHLTLP